MESIDVDGSSGAKRRDEVGNTLYVEVGFIGKESRIGLDRGTGRNSVASGTLLSLSLSSR